MATAISPDEVVPQPVVPPGMDSVAPVPTQPTDLASLYEDAVNNGDAKMMYSLTSRAKGTPYEPVVKKSAEIMSRNLQEFGDIAKPIMEAGGPGTPKGNLAAVDAYKTIEHKPQYGRAFVELLLGNKNWRLYVTGGTEKQQIGYDRNGNQLEGTFNELGKRLGVRDLATGKLLTDAEVAQRGGFLPSLENALGFQSQKELNKFNTEAFAKSNAATKDFAARAPELKNLYGEMAQRLQNLYGADLTEDQRRAIGAFTNRSMGMSQTTSQGLNALAQKVDNKNVSLSRQETNSLKAVMDRLGFELGADGTVSKRNGEAVTKNDLKQAQNTLNNSTEFERNFSQNKEDFIRSEVFKGLAGAEMQNLGRILDLQGMIEKAQLELYAKHGTLPFVINPKSYQLGDEFSRGQALALIGEYNQDVTAAYNDWRSRQLEAYKKTGEVPNAGELEAAFVQTDIYKNLKKQYADRNREILGRPTGTRPATQAAPAEQWSVDLGIGKVDKEEPKSVRQRTLTQPKVERESASIPKGYTKIGRTPDGKDVYKTPEGKTVVRE